VEHGITELVNGGVDLVEWMLRLQVPGLEPLDLDEITTERSGHSIEVGQGRGWGLKGRQGAG
jgi:acetyl/propionyl-CoA carboxylase alpha subunit